MTEQSASQDRILQNRVIIARYFRELRNALHLPPEFAAAQLNTSPEVISALECGRVEHLPAWPETVSIVMAYATFARIDGRPALSLISETIGLISEAAAEDAATAEAAAALPTPPPPRARRLAAAGAMRLPHSAFRQVRARPDRAFYALSLPLGLLVLALNASVANSALTSVSDFFRTHFGEVREGLRWIEVSDPRSRRSDKLQVAKR